MRIGKLWYANRECLKGTPQPYSLQVRPTKTDVFCYLFTKKVIKLGVNGHWSIKVNTAFLLLDLILSYRNRF